MGGSDAATRASHVVCFSDRDSGQQRRLRLWKMKPGRLGLVFANPSRPHNSWFRLFRLLPFLLVSFTTPLSLGSHKSAVSSNANILDNTVGYSNSVDCDLSKSEMSRLAEDDQKFLERVQSSIKTVKNWDGDIELLKECRAHIPWDELRNPNGTYSKKEDRMLQGDALFVQRFSRWFQKFMSWVNAPPCKVCGSKECEMKTVRGPESPEEIEAEAKRVEVYYCPQCKENTTTFPRYNKAKKLLETKEGRCGEYSNLFGLFCRSAGFETRLVLDLSDHLWTEVRLGDSWIMVDACEAVIDKPSMYEHGWGKKGLCYMIAIAPDHIMDITPRYTRSFLTEEFQTTRRQHTSSEEVSSRILQQLNDQLQSGLSANRLEELRRRKTLEEAELQRYKQTTEWTEQEKYGRGRISGSLAWKQSRQEAGRKNKSEKEDKEPQVVAGFEIEAFHPPISSRRFSLKVCQKPICSHDGIIVADTPCAIGEANSVSVVVVDEACLGCILQSRCFLTWAETKEFIDRLPSNRIVIMNGCCNDGNSKGKADNFDIPRLGGWQGDISSGVLFIGQVDVHPDWAFCSTLEDESAQDGHEVELEVPVTNPNSHKLRTERHTLPQRVAGRLPESAMPLKTQVLATEEQKRLAFTSFCASSSGTRYCGYTTTLKSPIYILDSTAYPFSKVDPAIVDAISKKNVWNTFHYLPSALVPEDDQGIATASDKASIPKYDVPLDVNFFSDSLGSQLLRQNNTRLPTSESLHNSRLIGLYFSAHWCGPCRSFTPMLAEMYEHLKDIRPTHGLEIVFVSSDRDENSFQQYFGTMPWQAIPFDNLQMVKNRLNMTYGVRGIPSFVVLDAVSGQVVIPANQTRQDVMNACQRGERAIEEMLDTWLERTPQDTREVLSMLELSCEEEETIEEENKENPYLIGEPKKPKQVDLAAEIKGSFEKLVSEGFDATAAAAKAIGMVAEEQKKGPKLEPGPLDGKAVRTGPLAMDNALDAAFAFAMERNPPTEVAVVLSTALKYLQNASKEPWSPKFRTFKLSNKVADKITRVDGGLRLLQSIGFEVFGTSQDFKATIPVASDLDNMNERIAHLLERLDEKK